MEIPVPEPRAADGQRLGQQLRSFFVSETERTSLESQVNRIEAIASLRFAIPIVVVALILAAVPYYLLFDAVSGPAVQFISAFFYLIFITIVWVMLWDPLEKLLYDGFEIRSREKALAKLGTATLRFVPVLMPPT